MPVAVVQEAWLRLGGTGGGDVENLGRWLTTVVSRVCLNMLRSRATRREVPLTPHVPDPIVSRETGVDPEDESSWPFSTTEVPGTSPPKREAPPLDPRDPDIVRAKAPASRVGPPEQLTVIGSYNLF
jgi:DNA-directed RNA polymerase specialized sigma24 family protein